MLTLRLHTVIQQNNVGLLKSTIKLLEKSMESNFDFVLYDCSAFDAAWKTASDILASHASIVPDLPPPPSPQANLRPPASFKPPKLDTPSWSGKSADFYPWLSNVLNGFNLTRAEDVVKVALTLQAIPLAKQGPFNNIIDWPTFKTKLIEEFGSIDIFGRDVNQVFNLLPRYESVQEVAEDLSPKIKTLQANLNIMENFHNKENLHSVAITQSLVQNIMRSLPMEVRPSFNEQFSKFREQCPDNVRPPATFLFLAQFVDKLEIPLH